MVKNIYDLIIIGAGPAGITAGIYACRERLKTLLIAKGFGGQVARKAVLIENYPGFEEISGFELIQKFKDHLKKFEESAGIGIKEDEVRKIKKIKNGFVVLTRNKEEFQGRAVIICSGADPRPAEVEGEKEYIGRGVSYCPLCDGPMFQGKTVAVIGGGNAGFEAAIFLSKIVKKVYILEFSEKVKADKENQERVKKTGKVEIITNAEIKEIKGEQFISSIIYQDRKSGKEIIVPLNGVFIEIGNQPATSFVKGLVDFNKRDEIKINPRTCETKTPGLFAAGDVTDVAVKQIIVAAAEGAKAAIFAHKYLSQFNNCSIKV